VPGKYIDARTQSCRIVMICGYFKRLAVTVHRLLSARFRQKQLVANPRTQMDANYAFKFTINVGEVDKPWQRI